MTDPEWADATYLEPLDAETVAEVIAREKPDAILPTLGGQTALNLAVELAPLGIELIGADLGAIQRAEDRELFRSTVHAAGIPTPRSVIAHDADVEFPLPAIVRPAFTLGGTGGGVAHTPDELRRAIAHGIEMSPVGQVLVEEYLTGWQEHELEVMCDARGNAVVVCSIENLDPMGIHTGDSWTIAPQQTLPDTVYQQLREEMNPRVSRSSALASKATGFPIAKLAALLAVGFTLDELPNDITGKTTAAFEPALDYVAIKAPRFDFEKFPLAERRLGAEMRAVGEALGLGRTFAEAFIKAMDGREVPPVVMPGGDDELLTRAAEPVPERWDLLLECARRGLEPPGIHPYFAARLTEVAGHQVNVLTREHGNPTRLAVDSCAGEFEARTPYYYVTHEGADEGPPPSGRSVIVVGAGPNRIGQAIEFDYCCVHAAQALRKLGYEAVLVNSNPETVSTDYDTSDRLYLEPLVERNVLEVCEFEQPVGVAVSYGGQTPLRLAPAIAAAGFPLLGDPLGEVANARAERLGVGGAEQAAVVLHHRATARAVDDDRCVAGHRGDHAPGQPLGFPRPARVQVQGATAIAARSGPRDDGAAGPHHAHRRPVCFPQPSVHHATGEAPRGGSSATRHVERRGQRTGRQARQAEPAREEPEALEQPRTPRDREQQPVHRQHEPVPDPLRRPPGAGGALAALVQRGSGLFHEMTELHRRRARGFAAPALHALVHGRLEGGVDRRAFHLYEAHRRDAAPRRRDLQAGDPVRRAVRQAQPARDARDELGLVEVQQTPGVAHSGNRPGASFPVGSNACLTRRMSAAFGRSQPNPSISPPPASRSIQPPCAWAIARAAVSTDASSPATCTVPTPSSAHHRAPGVSSSARPTATNAPGATDIRPRCSPVGSAGASAARSSADCASTSAVTPSSNTCVVRPSQSIDAAR